MTESAIIRLAGIARESIVDGPGIRFTIFAQGCPHHCIGCHNPDTHDFSGGSEIHTDKLLEEIDKNPLLAGVTFSGGEPFSQPDSFNVLAKEVKKRKLNIVIFTGYTYEELESMGNHHNTNIKALLDLTDILIDGRFLNEERDLTLQFRGSSNQRVIDMNATRESGSIILWKDEA